MTDVDVRLDVVVPDAVLGHVTIGGRGAEFVANIRQNGRRLEILRLHIQGDGPNTWGPATLRAAVQALMELLDVDEVLIQGADRTSGAAPGRTPAALVFRRRP